ncbi:MAG: acetolactate synthase small subunit [Candidatus Brocadiaceae bacterium]|nr:acetolactate synthase small subunit [Candidatus Brocadiaceae bacterium]
MAKHIISALVANRPGVLAHVAGLFSARGFNIDSLAVGETEQPDLSRMTIVVDGDEAILEQVRKQLGKVIDIVKIQDYSAIPHVERDLALVRVHAPQERRSAILELVDIFRARVVDVGRNDLMIETSGAEEKIEAFLDLLRPFGIREMARTGRIALARAPRD